MSHQLACQQRYVGTPACTFYWHKHTFCWTMIRCMSLTIMLQTNKNEIKWCKWPSLAFETLSMIMPMRVLLSHAHSWAFILLFVTSYCVMLAMKFLLHHVYIMTKHTLLTWWVMPNFRINAKHWSYDIRRPYSLFYYGAHEHNTLVE